MKKEDSAPHRIDDYLQRIEAREKAARRKKIFTVFMILAVMGIGFTVYTSMRSTDELRKFDVSELNYQKVQQLFTEDNAEILVSHAFGTDTVQSPDDYISLMDLVDQVKVEQAAMQREDGFIMDENETETEEDNTEEAAPEPRRKNTLQQFMVDIAGERKVGKELVFTIEDYNPSVSYTLDFGNGYRRKVKKVSKYIYSRPGSFRMRLVASSRDKGVSVYNKRFSVEGDDRSVIAESSTAASVSEDVRPSIDIEDGTTRNLDDTIASSQESVPEENKEESEENGELSRMEGLNEDTNLLASNSDEDLPVVEEDKEEEEEAEPVATTPPPPTSNPKPSIAKPLVGAEIMPEFPGGMAAMSRYVKRNYNYPKEARDNGVEGTVFVRFVVNPDGSLSNITVVRGIGYGCDQEALRIVKRMPNWVPGEHEGIKVPIYKTIPIGFKLLN